MKNNIAFFGASVTQQSQGYVTNFATLNPQFKINVFGFGSMHLKDAGICHIDLVLNSEPEYCFIDWFSTAYIDEAKDNIDEITLYIDTIIHKFYSKGVKIIFLTLPETANDKTEIHIKINSYLDLKSIPKIDISKSFESNIEEIIGDGIHTTPYGATQYANIISDIFFKEIYDKYEIPLNYSEKTKYCDIKKISLDKLVSKKITFEGNAEVIGISQYIGPYTGMLRINGEVFNNWDRWCYYEREMVNLRFDVNEKTIIEVIQYNVDTSSCKYECNWEVEKVLKLMTIFYTGDIKGIIIE